MDVVSPEVRSRIMRSIRSRDTWPERIVRSGLHRRGYRFRKHVRDLPGTPDIVFRSLQVAVFVDGDFWHGYQFDDWSSKLSPHWRAKIARNIARDRRNFAALRGAGWKVLRVWEHSVRDDPLRVVERISRELERRRELWVG